MPDGISSLENQQELKFAGEPGFFDKSAIIRYFIIFIFGSTLFIFLHFREVRVQTLELNTISPNYIVAQVDFDFPDEEATLISRQNALRDIGKIYRLAPREVHEKKIELDSFLADNPNLLKQFENISNQEFYQNVDNLEQVLLLLRITDLHTLEKLKTYGFNTADYQVYNINAWTDTNTLPNTILENIEKNHLANNSHKATTTSLITEFFKNTSWNLEEDSASERLLLKRIQSSIPEKIAHINAGSRIIDQGDKVNSRHVAMLYAMKQTLGDQRHLFHPLTLLGTLIMTLLLGGIFLSYFKLNQSSIYSSNRKLFLIVIIFATTLYVLKSTELFLLNSKYNLMEIIRYPLFIPLAAILVANLINTSVAAFISGFLTIIAVIALAFDWEGFLILNVVVSLVVILSTHSLRRRKEIFLVCVKGGLCAVAAIIALHLYNDNLGSWSILTDVLSANFFMILTAILVAGILPLLEVGFKIMTDVALIEYMDPHNDLLQRLTIEAPGTYQHSVVVGYLAEAAALAIGANSLFCRVASLYHDIGKMITSQYFTENQLNEVDIHQLLTPQESAHVIMEHVMEGVALGREAGLPEPIIDIIKQHHGTTLVYFFYRKEIDRMGGDAGKVDAKEFRYTGPKPRSKEAGIIMLADSFEAASRSLETIDEANLTILMERLARDKIDDGQFDQCLLTFEELSVVKNVLIKTFLAVGHTRIKYPLANRLMT